MRHSLKRFKPPAAGHFPYFFFFPLDGNTLATALAIEPATFATTPFLELRFFPLGFVFVDLLRALDVLLDFDVDFFFVAVFAITDSATPFPFQIIFLCAPLAALSDLCPLTFYFLLSSVYLFRPHLPIIPHHHDLVGQPPIQHLLVLRMMRCPIGKQLETYPWHTQDVHAFAGL